MNLLFWIGLAMMATAVTVAIRTGSYAPLWPDLNRRDDPRTFWSMTILFASTVAIYLAILLWVGTERLFAIVR